jgi:glycogen synthase
VHATEAGRHQGWLPGPLNQAINSLEWWLTHQARRVITCSQAMRWEVTRLFELPAGKVDVIPNGVDTTRWQSPDASVRGARAHWAGVGPMLLFSGRLEYEKGVHTVLDAMRRLRRRHPGCDSSSPVAAPRRMRCAPRPVGCGWDGRCVSRAGWTTRT